LCIKKTKYVKKNASILCDEWHVLQVSPTVAKPIKKFLISFFLLSVAPDYESGIQNKMGQPEVDSTKKLLLEI